MKVLTVIFVMMLVTLQYRLWIGAGSVPDIFRMNEAVAAQLDENQNLLTRNHALEAEVVDLKTGDAAIEERARSELGMIGQDETFFQIVDPNSYQPSESPIRGYKKATYRIRPTKICDNKDKCILPGFGQ
ncbi:MAG TPA: cell division protein FtsB [Gammaproteobacteria bacterium]|jgi:cell division protein FtsB|nr:cell division protein FtsB [Gammaproteobacteria bacterium]